MRSAMRWRIMLILRRVSCRSTAGASGAERGVGECSARADGSVGGVSGRLGIGDEEASACSRSASICNTSPLTMRPPGPVPATAAGSMPLSWTNRRTAGESGRSGPAAPPSLARSCSIPARGTRSGGGASAEAVAPSSPITTWMDGAPGPGRSGRPAGRVGVKRASGEGSVVRGCATVGAIAATPASSTVHTSCPTRTVLPAATTMCSRPACEAETCMLTLSVSRSHSASPCSTSSPSWCSQPAITPSLTDSPSCGTWISWIIGRA